MTITINGQSIAVETEAELIAMPDLVTFLADGLTRRGTQFVLADVSAVHRYANRPDMLTEWEQSLVTFVETLGWPGLFSALARAWPLASTYPAAEVLR